MMTRIFGANWKTSASAIGAALFSALTILAALPYELGEIATVIPPEWKAKLAITSAGAAFLLKIINGLVQKDRSVTGGVVQQTVSGKPAEAGTQTLVDATVKATIQSGEKVTPEQKEAIKG